MYKNNQIPKQARCLICHEPIYKTISLSTLVNPQNICINCYKQFKVLNTKTTLSSYPITILYDYDDFYKSLLYQYKGLYDYPLKDAFFSFSKDFITYYYKDYIVIPAPSSIEDNQKRGFKPVYEIAKTLNLPVYDCIYKKIHYKQSDLTYKERQDVKSKLGINNGELLKGKKVLILDDVLTTGSTLKACSSLVQNYNPQKIEILALSRVNHGAQ